MTGLCHETTEAVTVAAAWLVAHRHELGTGVVPALRARWPLSVAEAIAAIREAGKMQGAAHEAP